MPTIKKIKLPSNNVYDIVDSRINDVTDVVEDGNLDVVTSNGVYDYILQNCVIARDIEED